MDETSRLRRYATGIHPSSSPSVSDNGEAPPSSSLESIAIPDIPDQTTRLLLLSNNGDCDAIAALIANGVHVDVADCDNRTALHVASCMGHASVVDLLVRLGANVNVQDRWRSTPLSDAKHYGKEQVCRILENSGVNIPAENPSDPESDSANSADKLAHKAMLEDNVISSTKIDMQSRNLASEPTEEVPPGGFLHSSVKDVNLSKDFAAKELEMLELCLHAPLVSIRVGKIQRQGRFLCPTNSRGYLNLRMLPSSDMQLFFTGDDGVIEKIADIKTVDISTHVTLDMLDPDPSGRSFILRVSDGGTYFFWLSERSRILGHELLSDVKFLLLRRPTLSQLTGVDQSRLDLFVSNFEGIFAAALNDITSYSPQAAVNRSIMHQFIGKEGILNQTNKPVISSRMKGSASFISTLYGGSELDCVSKQLPITSQVDICLSREESIEQRAGVGLSGVSSYVSDLQKPLSNYDPFSRRVISLPGISPALPSASTLLPSLLGVSFDSGFPHLPIPLSPIASSTYLAPYYCPCPLSSSSLQYSITPPCLASVSDTISLSSSSFFTVKPLATPLAQVSFSLDRVNVSTIPPPGSSFLTIPTPLQASSLRSSFSDPIVHIPVIDFQSPNQTFLVSMPQAISACGISPVVPSFLGNIIPNGERSLRQELPAVNLSQCSRSDEDRDTSEMHLFLINNRSRSLLSSFTHNSKKDGVEQAGDGSWCSRLENTRSSVVDSILQCSGPSVGMVPAVLSSGGLSCACNFFPEMSTQPSAWLSGSRGLYGASCEPDFSCPSITSFSPTLGMSVVGADIFNIPKNKAIHTDTVDTDDLSEHLKERDDNSMEKGKEY